MTCASGLVGEMFEGRTAGVTGMTGAVVATVEASGAEGVAVTLAVTAGADGADAWLCAFEPCNARPSMIASTTNPAPKMSFVEKSVFIVCWLYSQRCQLDSVWTPTIQTALND